MRIPSYTWPFWSGLTAGRKRWRRRAQPYVCGRARRSVCRVVSASSSVDGPGGLDRRDRNAPQEKRAGRRARSEGRRAHARVRREDREAGGVPRPSRPAATSQCRVPGQGARRARPRSCLAAPSPPAPPPPSPSPPPRTPLPRAVCGAARLRSAWRARAAELFRRGRRAVPLRTAAGSVRARSVGARLLWPLALSISPPLCLGPSRLVPASCRGRRRAARSRRTPAAARLRQQDTRGGCGCPPTPPEGCVRMALSRASRRPSLAGLSAPSSLQLERDCSRQAFVRVAPIRPSDALRISALPLPAAARARQCCCRQCCCAPATDRHSWHLRSASAVRRAAAAMPILPRGRRAPGRDRRFYSVFCACGVGGTRRRELGRPGPGAPRRGLGRAFGGVRMGARERGRGRRDSGGRRARFRARFFFRRGAAFRRRAFRSLIFWGV